MMVFMEKNGYSVMCRTCKDSDHADCRCMRPLRPKLCIVRMPVIWSGSDSLPKGCQNNEVVYELLADMGWTAD